MSRSIAITVARNSFAGIVSFIAIRYSASGNIGNSSFQLSNLIVNSYSPICVLMSSSSARIYKNK